MAYFTLVTRDGPADNWAIQFGDYDRETVEFERDEYRDHGVRAVNIRILRTPDARKGTIEAAVERLTRIARNTKE